MAGRRPGAKYPGGVPETTGERILFALGLLIIAALGAIVAWESTRKDPPTPRPTAAAISPTRTSRSTTVAATTAAATTTSATTSAPAATTTAPARPPASRPTPATRLRLTARRDTWVAVRRTSPRGPVLFQGTMAAGESRTFTATSLSVRFGAAANVTATLNGRPLPLPGGTYSVDIGRTGLGPRSA